MASRGFGSAAGSSNIRQIGASPRGGRQQGGERRHQCAFIRHYARIATTAEEAGELFGQFRMGGERCLRILGFHRRRERDLKVLLPRIALQLGEQQWSIEQGEHGIFGGQGLEGSGELVETFADLHLHGFRLGFDRCIQRRFGQ